MGTALKVKCKSCKRKWTHYEGTGFLFSFYYCDKCGTKKQVSSSEEDNVNLESCKCGGSFRIDGDIICPRCQSKDVAEYVDKNGCNTIINWD